MPLDPGPQVPGIPGHAPRTGKIRLLTAGHTGMSATSCRPIACRVATGPRERCPPPRPPPTCSPSRSSAPTGSAGTVGEVAARHLHRRLRGTPGRRAGHRVVRPAGQPGADARADVGIQVRAGLRGRGADRPRPARPRAPGHRLRAELAASGYAGVTVRHVLDMRSGVRFLEEYTNPQADIRQLDEWIGWQPDQDDGEPRGLYRYLAKLPAEAPHGSRFLYRSANRTCWAGSASARPGSRWPS